MRRVSRRSVRCLLSTLIAISFAAVAQPAVHFNIHSQQLADALDRFGEQSGLQIVYEQPALNGRTAPAVVGDMPADRALDLILRGSGLVWSFVNERTVVVRSAERDVTEATDSAVAQSTPAPSNEIARLGVILVTKDPHRVLPNEGGNSAFGFNKPALETPRSVSFISEETIDLFGLSAVEDLVRVVPGAFTTTRYGIQGSIDIRNLPADTYFRGMKRLNLQGHARSVLAAMDTIEIVRGPPSPIDGMGKVGGFTNVVPKSGRARVGGYLDHEQGFAQLIVGAYDRKEASFGIGGPLSVMNRQGGYYAYGLLEDSDTYTSHVPIKQRVFQTALSIDRFIGPFRLETGANYQLSGTSGALLNRVTQDVIDSGRYIRGSPLAQLDLNGNGSIGYFEYNTASAVRGNLSAGNQPLLQRWNWPKDAQGNVMSLDQFPSIAGIPQSMYDYLVTSCSTADAAACADPTGLLRAQGVGGPLPASGYVPIGFVLDPRTVGYDHLDLRRAGAFERHIQAEFLVGFFDLIYDQNPDFTVRNQLFIDSMDQYKVSEQPSGGNQDVLVFADKLTSTYRWRNAPSWMSMNTLGSVIFRDTRSSGRRYSGDFGAHRTDVMNGFGAMTANSTFVHPFVNSNLYDDGMPWTFVYNTEFWEAGAGLLLDIDLLEKTNVLVGARYDGSHARNTNLAGAFNPAIGTAVNPGAFRATPDTATGWDRGSSWSVSVSHEVLPHVRPYVTFSKSSLTLDNNNNSLENDVIRRGHIGTADLQEAGIKASLFDDRLFLSTAVYEQLRADGSASDPSALLSTDITHTRTRGWESEVKWVPTRDWSVSLYGLAQKSVYSLHSGASILVDARALGFRDVLDAAGNVIYPAEAFLYGGRAFVTVPNGLPNYEEKQGNPNVQFGLNTAWQTASGLGFTLSGNYFSSVHSGRMLLVELPAAHIVDAGVFWEVADWRFKLDVTNLLSERYFRARTGDTLGDTLVQAMPTRRWQLTVKYTF